MMTRGEQARIAREAEVDPSYVHLVLKKGKIPSPAVAERLEKATGISKLHLLFPDEFDAQGNPVSSDV